MPGIQVAPSSGQNWLSSSSHGGATERCQVFKWRHLPDKTGYHHHHMVAPLSGAGQSIQVAPSSGQNWLSSGTHGDATDAERHKEAHKVVKGEKTDAKTAVTPHHTRMVAPLSGASAFKWRHLPDKTGYQKEAERQRHRKEETHRRERHTRRGRREAQREVADTQGAPLSGARYSSGAIFRTKLVIIIK